MLWYAKSPNASNQANEQIVPVMPSALVERAHVPYDDRMFTHTDPFRSE